MTRATGGCQENRALHDPLRRGNWGAERYNKQPNLLHAEGGGLHERTSRAQGSLYCRVAKLTYYDWVGGALQSYQLQAEVRTLGRDLINRNAVPTT